MTKLRLAIVGAGPAGIYAADILIKAERKLRRLASTSSSASRRPTAWSATASPPTTRASRASSTRCTRCWTAATSGSSATSTTARTSRSTTCKQHYDAVIFATGADHATPTSTSPASTSTAPTAPPTSSAWYDGHPDVPRDWPLDAAVRRRHRQRQRRARRRPHARQARRRPAAHRDPRQRPRGPQGLAASPTCTSSAAAARPRSSSPRSSCASSASCRDVDIVLYDEDFDFDAASTAAIASNQPRSWSRLLQSAGAQPRRPERTASRRLHLHFLHKPRRGASATDGRVAGIRFERTETGRRRQRRRHGRVPRDCRSRRVYRAVGYFGSPLPGIPFDERDGVIPNDGGRVLRRDGQRVQGVYATGWIKRGPVGLIGHTKSDAMETIRHVINDQGIWWRPERPVR